MQQLICQNPHSGNKGRKILLFSKLIDCGFLKFISICEKYGTLWIKQKYNDQMAENVSIVAHHEFILNIKTIKERCSVLLYSL